MEQEIEKIKTEVLNIQQDRMRIINEDNKHFQAIEAIIKGLQLFQTASNPLLATLREEIEVNQKAQLLINKLVQSQLQDLEKKLNNPPKTKLFNWFK